MTADTALQQTYQVTFAKMQMHINLADLNGEKMDLPADTAVCKKKKLKRNNQCEEEEAEMFGGEVMVCLPCLDADSLLSAAAAMRTLEWCARGRMMPITQ